VEMGSFKRNIGKARGKATVDGKVACIAEIMFAID